MHTHRGIYCICLNDNGKLLTVEKTGGPYKNRLDLPGGTPENGESEYRTAAREVLEETGYEVLSAKKIGERSYEIPWNYKHWTRSQHTALYYSCTVDDTKKEALAEIPDQDSKGALWINPADITEDWCSPLVWEAVHYLLENHIPSELKLYKSWEVLRQPGYEIS
jgi:8-oxo-dGTP pyrophosphatase MutT (NUDIX family)